MSDEYTQALADLERQRGLQEITNEQYLAAKATIQAERNKAGKPWRIFLLIVILLPVLFIGGCMALVAWGPKDTEGAGRAEVIQACRDDVRSQLKAPRTAKFSGEAP